MSGPKTNERPGTRAQAKHVRSSAFKAREVLNLIRNKPCNEAHEILTFSPRKASDEVVKVLNSALANASHNDGLSPDDLFVSACYADEAKTLRRGRARARGRSTPILKRNCHITVIVDTLDEEALAQQRTAGSSSGSAAQARRRRVLRSRESQETAEAAEAEVVEAEAEVVEAEVAEVEETEVVEAAEVVEAEAEAEVVETEEVEAEETEMAETEGDQDIEETSETSKDSGEES